MNKEAQRIAIATACGWRVHPKDRFIVIPPNSPNSVQPLSSLPDYLNDLNAMHEAEKVLTDRDEKWQCQRYANALEAKLTRDDHHQQGPSRFGFIHATAAQRAEAFLRTIGKWDAKAAASVGAKQP